MLKTFYVYKSIQDKLQGKVAIVDLDNGDQPAPFSPFLHTKAHYDKYAADIDEIVAAAKSGYLTQSVEAMLIMATLLKNGWPISEALAAYMAGALEMAAISFGDTEGGIEKKNAKVAKSFGLVRPRGAKSHFVRDQYIHDYIAWRIDIFSESLYAAAKSAAVAFAGTKSIKGKLHDICEKVYNKVEAQAPGRKACPSIFFTLKMTPEMHPEITFNDDDFLSHALCFIEDPHPNKAEWLKTVNKENPEG